jgi:hypothetical protein
MQTAGTVRKKSLLSDCEVPNSDFLSWKKTLFASLDCIFILFFFFCFKNPNVKNLMMKVAEKLQNCCSATE